jgi:3-oxoacyl-[acyl-carrier-protein] synthase I
MTYLVGAGAQTAVGHSLVASAAATRAGLGRLVEHEEIVDRSGEPVVVARAPWLGDEVEGAERMIRLGRRAAREALAQARRGSKARFDGAPLQVFLALPSQRPGRDPDLDTQVATGLGEALSGLAKEVAIEVEVEVEVIPHGHAAGLAAIARAHQAIREGRAEVCLAGGIDSYLTPETLAWLDEARQLRSTENRWGFTPGEAAGFCVLASEAYAARHGLRALAAVLGVGLAEEPHRIKSGTVCTGEGLTRAFEGALAALPDGARVDRQLCDLNGEPYRTDELGFTLVRTARRFVDPSALVAPADGWGDIGAATGPLLAGLVTAAVARGHARDRHSLLWASSEDGLRAAVLLGAEPSIFREK